MCAYLDNTVITVDAVLTKKGRERLSEGRGNFKITKFAVSDDEVDYSLYNTAHPLGTNYYSNIIESMPVLEAVPDESQTMRYKLVTLDTALTTVPKINVLNYNEDSGISLTYLTNDTVNADSISVAPSTNGLTETETYTLILFDEEAANVVVTAGGGPSTLDQTTLQGGPGINLSSALVRIGTTFRIDPKNVTSVKNTKIRVFGNKSGATVTIPLVVNPATT